MMLSLRGEVGCIWSLIRRDLGRSQRSLCGSLGQKQGLFWPRAWRVVGVLWRLPPKKASRSWAMQRVG